MTEAEVRALEERQISQGSVPPSLSISHHLTLTHPTRYAARCQCCRLPFDQGPRSSSLSATTANSSER